MYKEILGSREINISHDLSDRSSIQKEKMRRQDHDIISRTMMKLKIHKG